MCAVCLLPAEENVDDDGGDDDEEEEEIETKHSFDFYILLFFFRVLSLDVSQFANG